MICERKSFNSFIEAHKNKWPWIIIYLIIIIDRHIRTGIRTIFYHSFSFVRLSIRFDYWNWQMVLTSEFWTKAICLIFTACLPSFRIFRSYFFLFIFVCIHFLHQSHLPLMPTPMICSMIQMFIHFVRFVCQIYRYRSRYRPYTADTYRYCYVTWFWYPFII